jgi:cation transport regulator ChaC
VPSESIWYFAYGSNMSPAIFVERRGMQPLETQRGCIDGYQLRFDIPVGPGERAVANLAADAAARTHGVAYLLTSEDAVRLDRSESVPRLYYRETVEVTLAAGERIQGFTYRSTISRPHRKPSPRYIGLLLDGARLHGLPADYVAYLLAFELATDERSDAST